MFLRSLICILAIWTTCCYAQNVTLASNASNSIIFPREHQVAWRTLSNGVHLVGASVLSYCLSRRTDELSTRRLSALPLARWLVILIFVDSWLFIFTAGLLISGVGLSLNDYACSAGVFLCIVLYAISKLLIYWFLVEKVHLVHPHPSNSRIKSPAYRLCILFVFGYAVVIVLMIKNRIAFIRDGNQQIPHRADHISRGTDRACVIGLGAAASLSLLVYDLILNVFFTCMFLYPVYNSKNLTPRLKTVAKRTLGAALVALLTSAINVCVLTILHGQELGWICLASCGADTVVNALAIFVVTASVDDPSELESSGSKKSKSSSRSSSTSRSRRIVASISSGIRKILSSNKAQLPIVNAGNTSSARGILTTSQGVGTTTFEEKPTFGDVRSSTRSVHFSPDTTRQTRTQSMSEFNMEGSLPQRSRTQLDYAIPEVDSPSSPQDPRPLDRDVEPGMKGKSRASRPRLAGGATDLAGDHYGAWLVSSLSLASTDFPRPGTPEDTSVEVRQEGPQPSPTLASWLKEELKIKGSRLSSQLLSKAPRRNRDEEEAANNDPTPPPPPPIADAASATNSSNHSRSSASHSHSPTPELLLTPPERIPLHDSKRSSPVEDMDMRERSEILSALTRIAARGGGTVAGSSPSSPLQVSVAITTEMQIEQRRQRQRRHDMVDDFNGKHYQRRGRSHSSSGGL